MTVASVVGDVPVGATVVVTGGRVVGDVPVGSTVDVTGGRVVVSAATDGPDEGLASH